MPQGDALRARRLIERAIADLDLQMAGMAVLTEAGWGPYAVTPVIAAAAGASRVLAMIRDSQHGSAEQAQREASEIAGPDLASRIHFVHDWDEVPDGLDCITNLAGLRPLDAPRLAKLGPVGVVPLMYEAWERRESDLDLAWCRENGIPVAGTHEDFDGQDVFRSCGQLALKLCFEAGLEVHQSRILVVGTDRFRDIIADALQANSAQVEVVGGAEHLEARQLAWADAILLADYRQFPPPLGLPPGPAAREMREANPTLRIIQFAGDADVESLVREGFTPYPEGRLGPRRMGRTLAHLGFRPIVYLQAQGLKVAELLWRQRANGDGFGRYSDLVQVIP